jgi:hypothetical protein
MTMIARTIEDLGDSVSSQDSLQLVARIEAPLLGHFVVAVLWLEGATNGSAHLRTREHYDSFSFFEGMLILRQRLAGAYIY